MEKISEVLNTGRNILARNNIDINEARLLLAYVLNIEKDDLIKITECTSEEFARFLTIIERRVNGEPYAYIVGRKAFMGLDFNVNRNVLIPRPETELLVENAIEYIKKQRMQSVLDMCTGSGCIAVSIAKVCDVNVDAADISRDAIDVAKSNAVLNGVSVNYILSDLFENVSRKYDIIVSNPPYIDKDDLSGLQKEVQREPILALDGGEDGIEIYTNIIKHTHNYLNDNGMLLLEIGYNQGRLVSDLLFQNKFENIKVIKDLAGLDRVIICNITKEE